jgi:hypothetical protein
MRREGLVEALQGTLETVSSTATAQDTKLQIKGKILA